MTTKTKTTSKSKSKKINKTEAPMDGMTVGQTMEAVAKKHNAEPILPDESVGIVGIRTEIVNGEEVKILETKTLGEFIWCPPGTYTLDGREVTLTYGYWMGRYPVTQSQWETVMGSNPSSFQGPERPSVLEMLGGKKDLPVESVSWNDVQDFIKKANEVDGVVYRLPTEAEWEHAAMAGCNFKYAGSDDPNEVAWSADNSGGHTHPVGELKPNKWGFHDMSGNVWEWTHSDWTPKGPEGIDPGWVEVESSTLSAEDLAAIERQYLANWRLARLAESMGTTYTSRPAADKEEDSAG